MDKTMEILAQYGTFGQINPWFCSLYGLILMVLSVSMAVMVKKPEKDD